MKKIAIIGVTGSIGRQAVDVIENHPELFRLTMVSSHSNAAALVAVANRHKVPIVCFSGANPPVKEAFDYPCELITGENALVAAAESADYDIFLNAVVGIDALTPTLIAMKKGARIALSNKEMLVSAGEYVMRAAGELGSEIIPVDSEHSAIFQCLSAGRASDVDALIITSSGGAFRDVPIEELDAISPERALAHPNWNMGKKITIDCATMVNKGFEVIEAMVLFDLPSEKIEILMHDESNVHSLLKMKDGTYLADVSVPDMHGPIEYALYESKVDFDLVKANSLSELGDYHFHKFDPNRFKAPLIAVAAYEAGGDETTILNAANEEAVYAFLDGKIPFTDIEKEVERALEKIAFDKEKVSLRKILTLDQSTRRYCAKRFERR